jgi:hypothetical protein
MDENTNEVQVETPVEETQENQEQDTDVAQENAELKKKLGIMQRQLTKAAKAMESEEEDSSVAEQKPINNTPENDKLERLELRVEGYSPSMVDEIMKLGGKSFLANKIGAKVVEEMVTQEKATAAASIKSGTETAFDKKYSQEDLKNMSIEELEKILPHAN